jgi:hypothetical protein
MNISLSKRIGLCVLSGIGVGAIQINDSYFDWIGGGYVYYFLAGLLFAAAVLFPYLKRDDRVALSAITLAIASAVSYYCAVWLAVEEPLTDSVEWLSFTVASVGGAGIVLFALVWMTPVRATPVLAILVLIAAVIGGPVTYLTLPKDSLIVLLGHGSWHILMCLAIYYGSKSWRRTEIFE